MEPALDLPPLPPAHQRVGWAGFALALPDAWNLSHLSPAKHMHRQGLLVFSDLRGPTLEVRWKTPRRLKLLPANPQKSLQQLAKRLARKHQVTSADGAHILPSRGMALIADSSRLFELSCPRIPNHIEPIARDFLTSLRTMQNGPWLWCLYGISAWLPKTARLRAATLRPGDCRLEFTLPASAQTGPGGITLAALSLAQQLLRNRSLKTWATQELPCIRTPAAGTWQESENQATFRLTTRRLGRTRTHDTHLRHDPAANRIHWTHIELQSKNKSS